MGRPVGVGGGDTPASAHVDPSNVIHVKTVDTNTTRAAVAIRPAVVDADKEHVGRTRRGCREQPP